MTKEGQQRETENEKEKSGERQFWWELHARKPIVSLFQTLGSALSFSIPDPAGRPTAFSIVLGTQPSRSLDRRSETRKV